MNSKFKVIIATIAAILVFSVTACTGGSVGKSLNSAEALKEYLDKQPANSPDKPIKVTMNANAPMLEKIVEAINSAGKYVSLNLSGNVLTTIPDKAFANCTLLAAITIPDSVTSIGSSAYSGCTSLASVTIGNSVTSIGESAFNGCTSLASVTIPDSVTSIGGSAFSGCSSLASVSMSNSVDVIHGGMFSNTGLANLPLPKSADTSGSGGGKIFYYSKAGFTMTDNKQICHYLEAAPADLSGKLAWASSSYTRTNISGTETEIGAGRKNTVVILTTDAAAPAAKACKDYNYGTKTDWFLPSKDELNILYRCRNYLGDFSNSSYWSSSQSSSSSVWHQNFSNGYQHNYDGKLGTLSVRAVRAF